MKSRALVAAVLAVMTLGVAACSSDSSADGKPTDASSQQAAKGSGTAHITRLVVPATTACAHGTYTTVDVTYAIEGAASAELRVDGRPIPLDDPAKGTVQADVRCDPLPHDFVLFAFDDAGAYTTEKKNMEVT
jgi:hypothetical protein